jgi:hypothetical protein
VTGPLIWRALVDAANSPRIAGISNARSALFRRQMVRVPELIDRARALGIDATIGRRPIDGDGRRRLPVKGLRSFRAWINGIRWSWRKPCLVRRSVMWAAR